MKIIKNRSFGPRYAKTARTTWHVISSNISTAKNGGSNWVLIQGVIFTVSIVIPDFCHFHHVIWGRKWAKKLKTKNVENMSSGSFSHDAANWYLLLLFIDTFFSVFFVSKGTLTLMVIPRRSVLHGKKVTKLSNFIRQNRLERSIWLLVWNSQPFKWARQGWRELLNKSSYYWRFW